jgi:quinoprotein glucose dehydrogenase
MGRSTRFIRAGLILLLLGAAPRSSNSDWRVAGGGPESIRYSPLKQINRSNVAKLQVAWTYDTGDAFKGSELQCNPIIIDGVMYAATPKLRILALDAADGKLLWSFDPFEGKKTTSKVRNRGLVYWEDGSERRIYFTAFYSLYSERGS